MRLIFKKGVQNILFKELKDVENCSWRKLAIFLGAEWRQFRHWRDEELTLPADIFNRIKSRHPSFKKYDKFIIEERANNWGSRKGGILGWKTTSRKLKTNSEFRKKWIEKCRKGGINNIKQGLIKNWEVGFRNVGQRKFLGPNNEKMFTKTEKRIAEFFVKNKIKYEYEPLLNIKEHKYFPDFIIQNKIIIERCGLLSKKYFKSLRKKINDYSKLENQIVIIIPRKIYGTLKKNVKIPHKFITLIEDDNLTELTEFIGEYIGLKGSSAS